jgi:hypothetical protein
LQAKEKAKETQLLFNSSIDDFEGAKQNSITPDVAAAQLEKKRTNKLNPLRRKISR